MASADTARFPCPHCTVVFRAKNNVYAHIRRLHPDKPVNISCKNTCCICDSAHKTMGDLQNHIGSRHPDIKLSFGKITLSSMEEFKEWKGKMESKSQSSFVVRSSRNRLAGGSYVTYYHCHRSGESQIVPQNKRKRSMKQAGSVKIGKTCPASLKVHERNVKGRVIIDLEYQSTHVGHEMEVEKLPLSQQDRKRLALQLKRGIPKSTILTNIRKRTSPTNRLSFIRRKDLFNICRKFKVHNNDDDMSSHGIDDYSYLEEKNQPITELVENNDMSDISEQKAVFRLQFEDILKKYDTFEHKKLIQESLNTLQNKLLMLSKNIETVPPVQMAVEQTQTITAIDYFEKIMKT